MVDIIQGIKEALENGIIYIVRQSVEIYNKWVFGIGGVDSRTYSSKQKWVMAYIKARIPNVEFVSNKGKNESKRIISSSENFKALMMQLAEERAKQDNETEMGIIKKSAGILRNIVLDFITNQKTYFTGSAVSTLEDIPIELYTFFKWLLASGRHLDEGVNEQVECIAKTMAQSILFNIKTKRQVRYKTTKRKSFVARRRYQARYQIGLALSLRKSDRNNQVLRMLSAPGYGLSISPRAALQWETR